MSLKKLLLSLVLLLWSCQMAYSKPVDETTARLVASHFYGHVSGKTVYAAALTYAERTSEHAVYFAFTINKDEGFVLVAADDRSVPILGYSTTGAFVTPKDNIVGIQNWLGKYANEINYIIYNDIAAGNAIATQWDQNLQGDYTTTLSSTGKRTTASALSVAPLLTCDWNQDPFYNDACPFDNATNSQTVTGCPATAMAQIMKKWGYPSMGAGNYSFNSAKYGDLSANFGGTTYDWQNMPNSISSSNAEIARLMFQIGVAVEMTYGPASTGGSGAYVVQQASPTQHCSEYAFKNYFRYDSTTLRGLVRKDFSDADWTNLLRQDLDHSRPMQYAGFGPGGGHTWVCDGYDASGFFHMNWGWGGADNGFYTVDALSPGNLGTGGGSGAFNGDQQCLIGIQPLAGGTTQDFSVLKMNEPIQINPGTVPFLSPFTVTTSLVNNGGANFNGYIGALLFTQDGSFVKYVQVLSSQNIPAGGNSGALTFSTAGSLVIPGNYVVGIYTAGAGEKNWTIAGTGGFGSQLPFTIDGPANGIAVSPALDITPKQLVRNGPMTVNVNIANNSAFDFTGSFIVGLYDLNGKAIGKVGQTVSPNTIQAGGSLAVPMQFAVTLNTTPGTYLLAVFCAPDQGDTTLCGGANPINIIIAEAAVPEDRYEPNNDLTSATIMPLTFSGNDATIATTGATVHVGTDNDYYKVTFPAGHSYVVTPQLHDSYTDPNTYTVDAGFSVYNNGVESRTYDDTINAPIVLPHGGTVVFRVSTLYAGTTGTYLLTVDAARGVEAVEAASPASSVVLFPNPANSVLHISSKNVNATNGSVELRNVLGQAVKVLSQKELLAAHGEIDVRDVPSGAYVLVVRTGEKSESHHVVIAR
jgi:hypothetical protein